MSGLLVELSGRALDAVAELGSSRDVAVAPRKTVDTLVLTPRTSPRKVLARRTVCAVVVVVARPIFSSWARRHALAGRVIVVARRRVAF